MLLITSKATDMSYIVQVKVSKQHKLQFIAIYRHIQVSNNKNPPTSTEKFVKMTGHTYDQVQLTP